MPANALEVIDSRVTRLESMERRLKRGRAAFVLLVGLFVLCLILFTRTPDVLEARQLLLRDENGRVRVECGQMGAGFGLKIMDPSGRAIASIRTDELGYGALWLESDEWALNLGPNNVRLRTQDGETEALLAVSTKHGAFLWLTGRDGLPGVVLQASRDGSTELALRDVDGLPRAALSVPSSASPSLVLYDESGDTVWRAP